ncbi:MAG: EAL domain-containing protein [Elusimicrobiota bacterium]
MIDVGGVIHLLYFRLPGAERFERIHGEKLSSVARAELSRRFAALSRIILREYDILSDLRSPVFGTWAVPFELRPLEIQADQAEQLESIAAAARELGLAALEQELGTAVALHARLETGTLEVEDACGDSAMWMRRLDAASRTAGSPPPRGSLEERTAVLSVLSRRIDMRLQKIVSLETEAPVALEALARGPAGESLFEADRLFQAAARCGLREELELACLDSALEMVRRLPAPLRLAVNLSPDLYGAPAVEWLSDVPGLPERLILEITEHLPIASPERLLEQTRPLRENGAKIALDDAGCGFLNMDLVRALKPDIVKLCSALTRRIGGGAEILGVVRETVAAIRSEGAEVLAEGVETEIQARLARESGCSLAQGYYYGAPRSPAEVFAAKTGIPARLEPAVR